MVASAETLAYAVATGEVGDPRSFKRPVRVTVPRALPTDDVLVARKAGRANPSEVRSSKGEPSSRAVPGWHGPLTLDLVQGSAFAASEARAPGGSATGAGLAVLCTTFDEVRALRTFDGALRACARGAGAVHPEPPCLAAEREQGSRRCAPKLPRSRGSKGQASIVLPAPSHWAVGEATSVQTGATRVPLTWLALGREREWAAAGSRSGSVSAHGAGRSGGGGLARARTFGLVGA